MNRRAPVALVVSLTAALALAGCSSDSSSSSASSGDRPELKVSGGYMPRPVSDLAAGFIVVTNSGDAADKLTSVTSGLSDDITIHTTESQKMREVTSFDIPAGGELQLERGGSHIMFAKLKQRPEVGQKVDIELHFEKTDPITVELPVKETTYNPAQH
ncbi:copper chaperone PCu(A)C [Streptomyces sp. NPDC058280]|uniref:copper chaperone PCu(A)C n=1 Tax=Streptomyces sp. NPDC058280 TaxID=3346419 RepID=UPI0036E4BF1C